MGCSTSGVLKVLVACHIHCMSIVSRHEMEAILYAIGYKVIIVLSVHTSVMSRSVVDGGYSNIKTNVV